MAFWILLAAGSEALLPSSRSALLPNRSQGRRTSNPAANLLDAFMGKKEFAAPCVMGEEDIMAQKAHGTSATPVQRTASVLAIFWMGRQGAGTCPLVSTPHAGHVLPSRLAAAQHASQKAWPWGHAVTAASYTLWQ